MKRRKEPTSVVSGRVSMEIASKVEANAAELEMSDSQYVGLLVTTCLDPSKGFRQMEQKLLDAEATVKEKNASIAELKQKSPWQSEPLNSTLNLVLINEEILANLYSEHGRQPFPEAELLKAGFKQAYMLSCSWIGGLCYFFMVHHGWTYAEENAKLVKIRTNQ